MTYWLGIDDDIEDHVKKCQIYIKANPSLPTKPLLNNEVSHSPQQKVGEDFIEWSCKSWLLVTILSSIHYSLKPNHPSCHMPSPSMLIMAHNLTVKGFPHLQCSGHLSMMSSFLYPWSNGYTEWYLGPSKECWPRQCTSHCQGCCFIPNQNTKPAKLCLGSAQLASRHTSPEATGNYQLQSHHITPW